MIHNYYKLYCNACELIRFRGLKKKHIMDIKKFDSEYDKQGEIVLFDDDELIMIYITKLMSKLPVDSLKGINIIAKKHENLKTIIIFVNNKIGKPYAKDLEKEKQKFEKYDIRYMNIKRIIYNIPANIYNPRSELIKDPTLIEAIHKEFGKNLALVRLDDAISEWHGAKKGDIIKYYREEKGNTGVESFSNTCSIYYREVDNN